MTEGGEGAFSTKLTRRGLLSLIGGGVAAKIVGFGQPQESQALEKEVTSPDWGKIANEGHEGDLTRGIFFFAGEPNPNSPYPQLDTFTDWNSDENIEKIFDDIKKANVNVLNLSWWGNHGETEKWAPTINSKEVNIRVFKEALDRGILVAPVIEVSPEFEFFKDFPDNTKGFEERIETLISDYGENSNWLRMTDKKAEERHFIRLVETIHSTPVDEKKFAATFDVVSEKIFQKTGKRVIFGIDPTPLPPDGPTFGPNDKELFVSDSVVIEPYNIFSNGYTEEERIKNADREMVRWINSGIPVILPLITGFDDTGTDRPVKQKFGNNDSWRASLRAFFDKYKSQIKGVTYDSWNTVTEGGADAPTVEYGDVNYKFVSETLNDPQINPNKSVDLKYHTTVPMVATK